MCLTHVDTEGLTQHEREAELVRRWGNGEYRQVLGEIKATDREAHRIELAELLTPDQLETFLSRRDGGGK